MNLTATLDQHIRDRPRSPAIIDRRWWRDRITTFADLDDQARCAASLLLASGLQPGDVVLVFYPMSAELYVALLAIFRLGLVAMFLDPSAGREHIERCCALQAPRALIASTKAHLLRIRSAALRKIPIKFVIGFPVPGATRWGRRKRMPPCRDMLDCSDDTPALLTFTSGSTGQPKGAVRTHGLLLAQHRALSSSLSLTPGDIDVATLPIVLLANLGSGVTSIVPNADLRYPGAVKPAPIVAQMKRLGANSSVASPAFFERLARYCIDHRLTLPAVRKLFTGGAPVFPRIMDQMQQMAPAAEVVALYGSTEAEPIAHVARREIHADDLKAMLNGRGLLAGLPVKEIRLRIFRDQWGTPVGPYTEAEFEATCMKPDQPGEIVVAGDHVLKGYLAGRGDEETKFRVAGEVWHRTGDAGYLDAAGRLWLLGRCVARIHDERGELYPFAAETAVYQDPRIRRAAMVAHNGRRVLAIDFHDGLTGEVNNLKVSLAWTQLDEVRVCPRIPVDARHNAKIDYPALYRMLDEAR